MLNCIHIHLAQVWQTNMLEDATGWPDFILELQVTLWTNKNINKGTTTTEVTQRPSLFCFLETLCTLAHWLTIADPWCTIKQEPAACYLRSCFIPWRIHGTGIFTYMNGWFWWNMWVNIPYMDPMGIFSQVFWANQWKKQRRQTTIFNGRNPAGEPIDGCGYSANMFFHVCSLKSFSSISYVTPDCISISTQMTLNMCFFYFSHVSSRSCFLPSFSLKETTPQIFNHQDLSSKLCCRPSNTCPPRAGRRVDAHGRDNVGRRSWDTDAGRLWRQHSDLKPQGTKPPVKDHP